jgi:hypothetical protein
MLRLVCGVNRVIEDAIFESITQKQYLNIQDILVDTNIDFSLFEEPAKVLLSTPFG